MKVSTWLKQLLRSSVLYLVLRLAGSQDFVCLDTVSLCHCDATKLSVNCSHLRFRAIPLTDLPNVTSSLSFGGNFLTAVLEDTFESLSSLLRLSLENNLIAYVEPTAFDRLRELRFLDLSGNLLSSIPSALNVLTSLRVLNLSSNSISFLFADDLRSLSKLESLRLENNGMYSVSDTAFHQLANLESLYIDGNYISADPIGWFANSTRLKQLRMSGNELPLSSTIWDWFGAKGDFVPLEELHLDNNVISEISDLHFRKCFILKKLILAGNKIQKISGSSFSNLSQLHILNLDRNMLSGSFPANLFLHTRSLVSLSLEENSLSTMSFEAFIGLGRLLKLNLGRNHLAHVTFTPSAIDGPSHSFLPTLRSLNIGSNLLTHVPELRRFADLDVLDLSDNIIVEIEPYAFNGTSLQFLYLDNNQLTTLSLETFQELPDLQTVTVSGNPWTCDCRLFWLVNPSEDELAWETAIIDNIICKAPEVARDIDLRTLNVFQGQLKSGPFAPCEAANWLIIVIIAGVWTIVFSVVLVCYLPHFVTYQKGCITRSNKTKVIKAKKNFKSSTPPLPQPSTSPQTAEYENKCVVLDEMDDNTNMGITYVRAETEEEELSILKQSTESENECNVFPVTVISVV